MEKAGPLSPRTGGLPARRSRLFRRSSCEGWIGKAGGSRRNL